MGRAPAGGGWSSSSRTCRYRSTGGPGRRRSTLHEAGWDVTVISPARLGRDAAAARPDRRHRGPALPAARGAGLAGYLVEYLPSMLFTAAWLLHRRTPRADRRHPRLQPAGPVLAVRSLARAEGGALRLRPARRRPGARADEVGAGAGRRAACAGADHALARAPLVPDRRPRPRPERLVRARSPSPAAACRPTTSSSSATRPTSARYRELAAGATVDPHRVGYVGVMGSQDGLDLLLEAWAHRRRASRT